MATFVHQQEGDVVRAYDGTDGVVAAAAHGDAAVPADRDAARRREVRRGDGVPVEDPGFFNNWRVSYPTAIEGVDVDVVQGNSPTGMIGTLYFDKKTGLLKRYIRYANTAVGRIPTQVDYDDYRDVAGVKMPFKYSYAWVSERDDWTFTSYEPNVAIDAAKFGRPDPKTAGDPRRPKAAVSASSPFRQAADRSMADPTLGLKTSPASLLLLVASGFSRTALP